jgi:hypothetical protein
MNRLEWILGIMLVVLLIVVVVFSLLFWFRPDDGRPVAQSSNSATTIAQLADDIAPTSAFEGQTAKLAFVAARRVATAWQPDAKLLNATATWPQGATVDDLLTGETTWGFTFYSAESGNSATISVIENNAQLVTQGNAGNSYTPLDITGWDMDSDEAIRELLNSGGAQLINEEGITILTMALLADNLNQTNQLEWLVSLIATQSGRTVDLRINAHSGEVLEISQTP